MHPPLDRDGACGRLYFHISESICPFAVIAAPWHGQEAERHNCWKGEAVPALFHTHLLSPRRYEVLHRLRADTLFHPHSRFPA